MKELQKQRNVSSCALSHVAFQASFCGVTPAEKEEECSSKI